MNKLYKKLGQKALFMFDAETAHGMSISALKAGTGRLFCGSSDERLGQKIIGLDFANPIGMAAGYDKNGEVPLELLQLGFGFTEIGTITPLAQSGNPRPRIFRLIEDGAVINRLGFNNKGHKAALTRLKQLPSHQGIIGVNIGANKDSDDRTEDYVKGIETFYDFASYFTANISSPNTPGLRDLQARESLADLLKRCKTKRDELSDKTGRSVPLLLKIAPDLGESDLDDIAEEVTSNGFDGVIVSNTTLSRAGLKDKSNADQAGGLSGRPVFERSNIVLAKMRKRLGNDMAIIGVGGVDDAYSAAEKMRAGADLVQLYTGLVYQGPGLPGEITRGLSDLCSEQGLENISEIRDQKVDEYASQDIPQ